MGTVQAAIGVNGSGNQCFDGCSLGDIGLNKNRVSTLFRDHMDRLLTTFLVHIGNDEFGTFSGKRQRSGSPDP
jgi:hypothetical protein